MESGQLRIHLHIYIYIYMFSTLRATFSAFTSICDVTRNNVCAHLFVKHCKQIRYHLRVVMRRLISDFISCSSARQAMKLSCRKIGTHGMLWLDWKNDYHNEKQCFKSLILV